MAEEDFEKLILTSLAGLKKQLGNLVVRVTKIEESLDELRAELSVVESFLFNQSRAKGSVCARTAKSKKNEVYCTEFCHVKIADGTESGYALVGKRYYPKVGGYQCLVCTEFEK